VWAWTGTTWQPLLAVSFTNFDAVAANDPASGHIVAFTVNYEHFEDRQCSLDDPSDIPPAVRSSPGAIVPLPIESCHAVGATWRWDGSTWVRVVTSNGPPDLPAAAMAGSAGLGTVLLDATGATWRWDAERWHQASSSGPGRRYGAAMAFDTATGQLILFGGYAAVGRMQPDCPRRRRLANPCSSVAGASRKRRLGVARRRMGTVQFAGCPGRNSLMPPAFNQNLGPYSRAR